MNSSIRFASSAGNSEISRNESTCRSGITSRWVSAFGLMSRTATKPSAALTCSPSRTSPQKRQSSSSEDPFLRDRSPAHFEELADFAPHEPGRVVIAVPASGPVDEDDVLSAELRTPALQAGHARLLAQPLAPFALDGGGHRIG